MIVDVPADIGPAEELGRVHFVGLGGAALSGLARIMAARGVAVSGSDAKDSAALRSLRALGVTCYVGHRAEQVDGVDTVVVSTAVPDGNPEVRRARELGLRVWPRSAAVQSVLLGRTAVVVTGTHGKTTTTSMLTTALLACGADPSYAIGSTLNASGLNAAAGTGSVFVAEGDESDAAILAYTPAGAVVTNIDADHLDHFGTPTAYAAVFEAFLDRIRPGGFLVCCVDDPGARRLAALADGRDLTVVRVGQAVDSDLQARDLELAGSTSQFDAWRGDTRLGRVRLQVPGVTYAVDALAALAAGLELGFAFDGLADGLGDFLGSGRRMEPKGEAAGVRVFDSYAHHPSEIAADLRAARVLAGDGRVVVCFQPHLFSRTRIFAAAMGEALAAADEVVVMDVYPARELPEPGVDGSLVSAAVPLPPEHVRFEPTWSLAAERTAAASAPGDLVLTLGAGDVTEVADLVLALLTDRDHHEGQAVP
ncbi:MAG: UDP-N-acetylmuramate--alanine ligase [Frankiaceae bacterium]|nr:UDP-N-acetylmuramate--alanine ligase [Frankiaceae bacterium]